MGTVHGVYLKYVGLSAISYAGYSWLSEGNSDSAVGRPSGLYELGRLILGYSAVLNGTIAVLFKMEWGMGIIGKNKKTGQIPSWSYGLFFPFHIPTKLYTHIHTKFGKHKMKDPATGKSRYDIVPVANEVVPGWYVGGCYGHELGKEWGGVIDLTVEFPETCRATTKNYLSAPTWDGVPLAPDELDRAASFGVEAKKDVSFIFRKYYGLS